MTSPLESWSADRTPLETIEDAFIWWLMLPKGREYTIGKKGIYHQVGSRRHHYNHPKLGEVGVGAQVDVRYSDRLPEVIGIFYRGVFVCVAERSDAAARDTKRAIANGRYERERMVNEALRQAHREVLAEAEARRAALAPNGTLPSSAGTRAKPSRRRSGRATARPQNSDPAVQDLLL
jgi:hypothetical protein